MRRMYSEKQVKEFIQKAINSGEIPVSGRINFVKVFEDDLTPETNNELTLPTTLIDSLRTAKSFYVWVDFDTGGDNLICEGSLISPTSARDMLYITLSRWGGVDSEILDPICIAIDYSQELMTISQGGILVANRDISLLIYIAN